MQLFSFHQEAPERSNMQVAETPWSLEAAVTVGCWARRARSCQKRPAFATQWVLYLGSLLEIGRVEGSVINSLVRRGLNLQEGRPNSCPTNCPARALPHTRCSCITRSTTPLRAAPRLRRRALPPRRWIGVPKPSKSFYNALHGMQSSMQKPWVPEPFQKQSSNLPNESKTSSFPYKQRENPFRAFRRKLT